MSNQNRRNVVMILCDSLRPDFLHAYGADFIPTPNIDALADNGMVFDNAITASTVCAPARAAIKTGQFVSGHDAWTNNIPFKAGMEFLPERLSAAGYMTAATGCLDHASVNKPLGYQYLRSFKEYFPWLQAKHPEVTTYAAGEDGSHFDYPEEDFYDRWVADRATEFIDSYVSTGKAPNGAAPENEGAPFYLYCGFLSPHSPHMPPKEVNGTVDPDKIPKLIRSREDVPEVERYRRAFLYDHETLVNPESADARRMQWRKAYCEMIVEVDALVGRIVQSLKDNGVYENTTIIFSSDHGSVEHDYDVMTKGPWPYRAQLFIPMIISNHPRLNRGTRCDALCGNLDIGATVLDIAGDTRRFGVSRSMLGLADGSVPEREVNMSEFCDSCKNLVDKRYTFSYYPFTGETCLFDREKDPGETTNVTGRPEYAQVERRFLMHAIDFMILAKGVRIECHDLVPGVKAGIEKKDPKFLDDFDIAYPLATMTEYNRLKEAGLDADYNEFCKTREIKAHYGVYFMNKR